MRRLGEDVFQIPLVPRSGINAYLLGDVLVDAGTRFHGKRILSALTGYPVSTHVLTHGHVDHAGSSKQVAAALGVPVWAGARDTDAVRSGRPPFSPGPLNGIGKLAGRFPGVPVARELREGDEVGPGFVVLDTPGHTDGAISLWRERDRVLICGDVIFAMNVVTTAAGVHEPLALPTIDPALNRQSIRKIAALEPQLTLAGHGPPLVGAEALRAFAAGLPA